MYDSNLVVLKGKLQSAPQIKCTSQGIPVAWLMLMVETPSSHTPTRYAELIVVRYIGNKAELMDNYYQKNDMVKIKGYIQITDDGETIIVATQIKSVESIVPNIAEVDAK